MQSQINGNLRCGGNVEARLVIRTSLARRHPGEIDHEGQYYLDGFVFFANGLVGQAPDVVGEAFGEGACMRHEQR